MAMKEHILKSGVVAMLLVACLFISCAKRNTAPVTSHPFVSKTVGSLGIRCVWPDSVSALDHEDNIIKIFTALAYDPRDPSDWDMNMPITDREIIREIVEEFTHLGDRFQCGADQKLIFVTGDGIGFVYDICYDNNTGMLWGNCWQTDDRDLLNLFKKAGVVAEKMEIVRSPDITKMFPEHFKNHPTTRPLGMSIKDVPKYWGPPPPKRQPRSRSRTRPRSRPRTMPCTMPHTREN